MIEIHARSRQDVHVRRVDVRVTIAADGERTVLIAENPDHIGPGVRISRLTGWRNRGTEVRMQSDSTRGLQGVPHEVSAVHESKVHFHGQLSIPRQIPL